MSNGIIKFVKHAASAVRHRAGRLLEYKPRVQVKNNSVRVIGKAGYVHAACALNLLPEEPIVYSFGVGEEASYELELIRQHNAQVYAFDPTPKSISWVESNIHDERFHFFPYGLSDKDEQEKFYLPENPDYVSGSIAVREGLSKERFVMAEMRSLSSIVNQLNGGTGMGHEKIDVLKLDVQGSEFKALPNILSSGIDFTQLSLGVYTDFFIDGIAKTKDLLLLLSAHGYYVAYSDRLTNHLQLLLIRK